jgi:penicillin amidase
MSKRWTIHGQRPIRVVRDRHGVPHIRAQCRADAYLGLGYCHGVDRALQLLLLRIVGAGRASEFLDASDEMLAVDRFFRRMNFGGDAEEEVAKLMPGDRTLVEAYCQGVNRALGRRRPWELRLLRYRPAPWTVADTILLSRVVGYVLLAQSQGDLERLVVEMVQAGVARDHLEELFPGLLQSLDVDRLRKVKLGERVVPAEVRWSSALPHVLGSNNWVIAPRKTATGQALLANDPHLEANRLPAIWYEAVVEEGERFCIAATMPGVPGFPIGRNNDLAWGATYTFMDATDSWIEDCRDGCYRRVFEGREHWVPFRVREERIERKQQAGTTIRFYETEHGVLDREPSEPGLYLATRWSSAEETGATSLSAMFGMLDAPDVSTGMELLGRIETAWNFVLADRHGNIGYQMSGRMPIRRAGWKGFVPVPGWDPENDWRGFVPPPDLPRVLNPEAGFLATANNDLNDLGRVRPINVCQGPYRVDRIARLLEARDDWTVDDIERMQMDVYSLQAERFMAVLRPLLPDGPMGEILRTWDGCYPLDSRGAYLFEQFYQLRRGSAAARQRLVRRGGEGRGVRPRRGTGARPGGEDPR